MLKGLFVEASTRRLLVRFASCGPDTGRNRGKNWQKRRSLSPTVREQAPPEAENENQPKRKTAQAAQQPGTSTPKPPGNERQKSVTAKCP